MNISGAISVLRKHKEWRRATARLPDDSAPPMASPYEIWIAIDVLCDKMQSMAGEIARLQDALFFWLPNIPDGGDKACTDRMADDAALLIGREGRIDDSAEQRGWVVLMPNASSLAAFARDIMAIWPEGGLDGGDLQEIAVKHGLLVPETRHAPCGEEGACSCAEYATPEEFAAGVTCYRRAEWLRAEKVDGQAVATAPERKCANCDATLDVCQRYRAAFGGERCCDLCEHI